MTASAIGDLRAVRRAGLRDLLARDGLDALLVSGLPNIQYLTGFSGSSALLVVSGSETILLTDFRYASQAEAEVNGAAEVQVERISIWDGLKRRLEGSLIERLGFERDRLTVRDGERLGGMSARETVGTGGLVESLRVRKDPTEVAAIRAAAGLAVAALSAVKPFIRPGLTELEIAAELEGELRRRGSEWHPFQSIVASGPRSALPHARPTTRVVERGDFLLLDFGAQVRGYCADITRTFVVGAPATDRQRRIYNVVRAAQTRAKETIAAGMSGRQADLLAREVIISEGFGDAFGHSLGHGLGLEIHEDPRLSQMNESALPVGAVVTVEPGVYLEGWGGVRIEDDVWLGAQGSECLSHAPTELIELL
ncbi:MAG: aminopeptidase P family protein [Gemmatimonadota bacterium]